jgi:hypothetical protein
MTATERDLIIKLPYRVGLWISRADDKLGFFDDKVERARLEAVIERVAKHHETSSFVRNILANTLSHANDWPEWAAGVDTILADCKTGLNIVKAQSSDEDVKTYRVVLMQTAVCVAEAFQEDETVEAGLPTIPSANDQGIPENISKAEKRALEQLKKALWGTGKK